MYNSQYYTCEQIDQRLLQGYLDDYNTQNNTNLTKAEFLTLLFNTTGRNNTVDNLVTQVGYYECDTAARTAAKAITVANYNLFAGGSMKVKFVNKNTANNATLNINSQGAKALYYQGERASSTNSWDEGEVVEIYYDGTSYYANNVKGGSGSGVYDVSVEHPTSGPNEDGKFTLEYILNPSNVNELIPVNKRYPGISIQFVSTYNNKYVQARCMAQNFTTNVTQWQGVDDKPTPESKNLVDSGGTYNSINKINEEIGIYTINVLAGRVTKYINNVEANKKYIIEFVSCTNEAITNATIYAYNDSTSLGNLGTVNVGEKINIITPNNTNRLYLYNSLQTTTPTTAIFKVTKDIMSIIDNMEEAINGKVDKVEGKGLSTNDYTDSDKEAVSQLFGETTSRSYVKTNGRLSEYIPAKASKKYNISFTSDNVVWPSCRFLCYDDSSYLEEEITVNSGETGILETPAGTTKILAFIGTSLSGVTVNVSITIVSNGVVDEINAELEDISDSVAILENNTLIGKKIMCFGDSITEFNTAGKGWVEHASALGGDFIRGACGGSRYVPRATATDTPTTNPEAKGNFDIANLVDAWVNNHWTGVDASVEYLEGQHAVSVANLKVNPVNSVDMVVLMGGTNDFSSNIPIGEVTDINITTILGAIKHCVQVILTANPKIKIYVLSPLVRYFGSDITDRTDANWCDNYANNTGKTTADMVDAQGDVAKYMHTPFCNLYYELGWNQYNFSEYFRDDDNTHPHNGFKVLAERIHSWLTAKI